MQRSVSVADMLPIFVGVLAAIASVCSFAPQAWKIIRTRDTTSISSGMYALTVTGFVLWLVYGLMLSQWPLIFTNAICLVFASFILVMKLVPKSTKKVLADAVDLSGTAPRAQTDT